LIEETDTLKLVTRVEEVMLPNSEVGPAVQRVNAAIITSVRRSAEWLKPDSAWSITV
jgi:hypothetical protein